MLILIKLLIIANLNALKLRKKNIYYIRGFSDISFIIEIARVILHLNLANLKLDSVNSLRELNQLI